MPGARAAAEAAETRQREMAHAAAGTLSLTDGDGLKLRAIRMPPAFLARTTRLSARKFPDGLSSVATPGREEVRKLGRKVTSSPVGEDVVTR